MSEFSVGDEVQVVSKNGVNTKTSRFDVGDIGVISDDWTNSPWVRLDEVNDGNVDPEDLELISKGGQNEMENLEAIAVVGDDDLREKLIEIAEENDWQIFASDVSSELIFNEEDRNEVKHNVESLGEYEFDKIYQLPQDWEKAKKFVTQNFDESLELAEEEVEVDGKEFSIGCYTGHLDDLQNLLDGLHGLNVNEVEITEQGHSVDIDDLIELRKFVEGKQ